MKLALLTLATAATLSTGAFAGALVDGGKININGEIVNAACAVTSQTATQTVTLGQYTPVTVGAATNGTTPIPFEIRLTGCSVITGQENASIGFSGQTVAADLLAVSSGTNAPAATGVGIEIKDANGAIVGINQNYSGLKPVVAGNDTVFNFSANYRATTAGAAPTPGLANAVVNFKVNYQ